jgi:phosphoglycolate phosphatase
LSRCGILFDLDGTLADTAPDLVAVLNVLLVESGRPPVPFAIARNEVSNGALGLIRLGFGIAPEAPVEAGLRQEFLDLYERIGHENSRLFIALSEILDVTSRTGSAWGIVTNKPESMTDTLLERLGIGDSVGVVVCGDTLPERKPHPAPLLHAARELGVASEACIYLGDARRDIEAGRAAGMRTVVTSYGYIRPGEDFRSWGYDAEIDHPRKIGSMLHAMIPAD